MLDLKSDQIESRFDDIIKDIAGYREVLEQKLQALKECKAQVLDQVE